MFKKDTVSGTFIVAGSLCIACAILVSVTTVILRPFQYANRELDKKKNILLVAGLLDENKNVDDIFNSRVNAKVVEIETGEYVTNIDPATFDALAQAKDSSQNRIIPSEEDKAGIRMRARHAVVYEIKDKQGQLDKILLPIYGKGLWSTLYGFLAVAMDGNTVKGIGFYQHGETPGLGGEVDNPKWKALWDGKLIRDNSGNLALEVMKGAVNPGSSKASYQVDGLSGATLTSRGVSDLVRYWLGQDGFASFLDKLKG